MNDSYCARIKRSLCQKSAAALGLSPTQDAPKNECCKRAFFASLILFGCETKGDALSFKSRTPELCELFYNLCTQVYGLRAKAENGVVTLPIDALPAHLLPFAKRSPEHLLDLAKGGCGECINFIFRALFLCRGTMASPESSHQLNLASGEFSQALLTLLNGELPLRRAARRGHDYLYLRKASDIEDFLIFIGAQGFAMALMDSGMERVVRSLINRQNNFDTANLRRSTNFRARLDDAIKDLEARGRVRGLPESLRTIVRLRKAHPEDSLSELGERTHLSKSGLYHRLKKIIDLSENKEV